MTIKTEVIKTQEVAKMAEIHRACFERPWDALALMELLAVGGTKAFMAQDKGFAILRLVEGEAEILTLAVLPEERRKGIAAALVQDMLSSAKAHGASAVFLEVNAHNQAAGNLYEKAGFSDLSRRKGYYREAGGSFADARVMRKMV